MYHLYKKEVQAPVAMFIFRRIFYNDFNLTFHSPLSDSCQKCDAFEIKIKAAEKDGRTCEEIRRERELHHRKAESEKMA